MITRTVITALTALAVLTASPAGATADPTPTPSPSPSSSPTPTPFPTPPAGTPVVITIDVGVSPASPVPAGTTETIEASIHAELFIEPDVVSLAGSVIKFWDGTTEIGSVTLTDGGRPTAPASGAMGDMGGLTSSTRITTILAPGTHALTATLPRTAPFFFQGANTVTYVVSDSTATPQPPTPEPPTPTPEPSPALGPTPPVAAGTGLAALQAFLEWLLAQLLQSAPFWPTAGLPSGLPHIAPLGR